MSDSLFKTENLHSFKLEDLDNKQVTLRIVKDSGWTTLVATEKDHIYLINHWRDDDGIQ